MAFWPLPEPDPDWDQPRLSLKTHCRAGPGLIILSFELNHATAIELEPGRALEIAPSLLIDCISSYNILRSKFHVTFCLVKLSGKLEGFAKIWVRVASGIGLFY